MDKFTQELQNLVKKYVDSIFEKTFKYKREIFELLKDKLIINNKNILLIGLRQIGKTFLIEQLAQFLYNVQNNLYESKNTNIINSNLDSRSSSIFYINLKAIIPNNINEMNIMKISLSNFIKDRNYKIILLDEIQVIDGWSDWLQALIDLNKTARFIVSGSNSTALKKETILNRIDTYFLRPLTFKEYLRFWEKNWTNLNEDKIVDEYLKFGSYPKTSFYNDPEIQYLEIIEPIIIDRVLSEDTLEQIDRQKFYFCLQDINNYIGNEIIYSNFEHSNQITRQFAKKYIDIMINSSLVYYVSKYKDKNIKSKVKIYYEDKSMIHYFAQYAKLNNNLKGSLIENLVFNYLLNQFNYKKFSNDKIFYYRNNKDEEIDFIIPNEKILIEVKYVNDINKLDLTNELNRKCIDLEIIDFKKIIINNNIDEIYNGWEFISLKKFLIKEKI